MADPIQTNDAQIMEAYRAGIAARKAGLNDTTCPHDYPSTLYHAWKAGWYKAEIDALDALS